MLGAGSSMWSPGSSSGARRAPSPWGSVSPGKGGLAPISFTHLETELRKHQAWGLRVPCRLDKPQRWIWQPGQCKGNLPWVLDRAEGHGDRLPVGRHSRRQPHAATCSEPALPSVWLLALSAAAPKAEGKEESREREKAQLVDEQRKTCRKPSPPNTSNR